MRASKYFKSTAVKGVKHKLFCIIEIQSPKMRKKLAVSLAVIGWRDIKSKVHDCKSIFRINFGSTMSNVNVQAS